MKSAQELLAEAKKEAQKEAPEAKAARLRGPEPGQGSAGAGSNNRSSEDHQAVVTLVRDYLMHKKEATEILNSKQIVFIVRDEDYEDSTKTMADAWHKKFKAFKQLKADHEKDKKAGPAPQFDYPYKKIFMWTCFMDQIGTYLDKRIADTMGDGEGDSLKTRLGSLRGACRTLEAMSADEVDLQVGTFAAKFATPISGQDRPWKWVLTLTDLAGDPFKQMLTLAVKLLTKECAFEVALRRQYATSNEDELWEYVKKQPKPASSGGKGQGRGRRSGRQQ